MEAPIRRLITVVIQDQDLETAMRALARLNVSVTHLVSSGGFLGRRNATLLIALSEGMEESVVRALKESCRQRVEYLAVPMEGSPLPLPAPVPVTVGGATIFSLPVEYYEEV